MSATFTSPIFPTNYTFANGNSSLQRCAARFLSKRSNAVLRELGITLNGVAAGSTAAVTRHRIEAAVELGGVRTIETDELVNRATVSADQTELNNNLFDYGTHNTNPPSNGNGNPLGSPGLA